MCRQLYFYNHLTQVQGEGAIHKWRHPLGEGGLAKRWCYSISQFGKMGDKGGVKNLKKMSDVIYEWPRRSKKLKLFFQSSYVLIKVSKVYVENFWFVMGLICQVIMLIKTWFAFGRRRTIRSHYTMFAHCSNLCPKCA